jgi:NADPH-dependent 2,4-dienoyl-CoA reductase/sulfur reductase-like enzyme
MRNRIEHNFDILVLGGGPAGIAAACAASSHARVAIVDENPALGGQIWRNAFQDNPSSPAATWHHRLRQSPVTHLHSLRVFDAPAPGILHAETPDGLQILRYKKLILATGARERFLPFPGWTLPNVMGAGGLQAMVKSGLPIAGKRVVVAGTGPLLLAVAAFLKNHRAQVVCICEQAPLPQLARFPLALLTQPSRLLQAAHFRLQLARVPYRIGWWIAAAHGAARLASVTVTNGSRSQNIPCDYLACGFHLVPNVELPSLLGCALRHGFVAVNSSQQSSVQSVYCAGEITGIGGLDKSLVEGAIAGYAATGQDAATTLARKHRKAMSFALAMHQAFALRPELRHLPAPSTLVCRCEDVSHERLQPHHSWRSAKLHTRCGMGPCQGRICGAATQFLYGWLPESVRPPILPVRFQTLADADNSTQPHQIPT